MLSPEEELAFKLALEQNARICREDYSEYVEYVHGGRWVRAKHLVYICKLVQDFIETETGNPYDILILTLPPQHGKSMTMSETLPSWYLGKHPEHAVILASYNATFAEKFGRRNIQKIEKYGKEIFGIELSKAKNTASEFELSNGVGRMQSSGILGGVTGNPANLIIIDDPIKTKEEADSKNQRDKIYDEWDNSFKTRCAVGTKVIIIHTRWHEDDLAGRLLKNERNIKSISLPCEAEANDPLGREVGDGLFPEIGKGRKWKDEFKAGYSTSDGLRSWLALFQCRPTAQEGNMIKRHFIKRYKRSDIMENGELMWFDEMIQSWDCTFKDSDGSDYVAGHVWGRRVSNYYLLKRVKKRMGIVATMESIKDMSKEYPKALAKLIEDKANGSAVIEMLGSVLPGIIAVNPQKSKVARVNAVLPAFESGNVYVPEEAEYDDFIEELVAFPNGSNDDDVDATSQALNRFIYHRGDRKPNESIHSEGTMERKVEDHIAKLLKRRKDSVEEI